MAKEQTVISKLPPAPCESPEGWSRLRKHLDAGEWTKCEADLSAMGLSPKLVNLFAAAVQEDAELSKIEAAGEGQGKLRDEIGAKLRLLHQSQPQDLVEVEKIHEQAEKLKAQSIRASQKVAAAERASNKRRHLQIWLAPLFGLEEIDPRHGGALGSYQCADKVFAEAMQLSLSVFKLASWRELDKNNQDNSRRVYTTFSVQKPADPIHL